MGKTFQAAQLTHERFLTMDHSCKIFFWYLPNWTSTNLWCVVLYVTYSTTQQRSVEVQFGRYQKNILQEWSMSKISHVLIMVAWNVFPIHSLVSIRKYWTPVVVFSKHSAKTGRKGQYNRDSAKSCRVQEFTKVGVWWWQSLTFKLRRIFSP